MITEVDRQAGEFRKRAETSDEVVRLAHEAEVLGSARHPGVVQLLQIEPDRLTLRLVEGATLGERARATGAEMDRIALYAATTLADLHDLGVAHQAISAEHIVVDDRDQPIFCSFGRSASGVDTRSTAAAHDVIALARTLTHAGAGASVLASVARSGPGPATARGLATVLASPAPTPGRPRLALALAGTVMAAAILLLAVNRPAPQRSDAAPPQPPPACPAVDLGCHPLTEPRGILATPSGRYRIGQPTDLVVVGRWRCSVALPALLRATTGEVWVWDRWAPPGAPAAARLATRIPGARSIVVEPGLSSCDALRVLGPSRAGVVVHPDRSA